MREEGAYSWRGGTHGGETIMEGGQSWWGKGQAGCLHLRRLPKPHSLQASKTPLPPLPPPPPVPGQLHVPPGQLPRCPGHTGSR